MVRKDLSVKGMTYLEQEQEVDEQEASEQKQEEQKLAPG